MSKKPKGVFVPRLVKDVGPGRNDPCPCGSGLKLKKCHGDIVKIQLCQQAASKLMQELITEEVSKKESEVSSDGKFHNSERGIPIRLGYEVEKI